MPNAFTTLVAIILLILIVLAIRFILKHGSSQGRACTGNCMGCAAGCASRFSPERKDFDRIMGEEPKA